jgi:hypothetical protein
MIPIHMNLTLHNAALVVQQQMLTLPASSDDEVIPGLVPDRSTVESAMQNQPHDVPNTTGSGRRVKRPSYLDDYITSNVSQVDHRRVDTTTAFTDDVDRLALMLIGNQDNFYYHEILHESDKDKFIAAMKEEIQSPNSKWCLQVVNNIYGQKQAGLVSLPRRQAQDRTKFRTEQV